MLMKRRFVMHSNKKFCCKKFCCCRGTVRRTLSLVTTKVTFKLTRGHWYSYQEFRVVAPSFCPTMSESRTPLQEPRPTHEEFAVNGKHTRSWEGHCHRRPTIFPMGSIEGTAGGVRPTRPLAPVLEIRSRGGHFFRTATHISATIVNS